MPRVQSILAARLVVAHHEVVLDTERAARRVDRPVRAALAELVRLAKRAMPQGARGRPWTRRRLRAEVRAVLHGLPQQVRDSIRDLLADRVRTSYDRTVQVMVDTLPQPYLEVAAGMRLPEAVRFGKAKPLQAELYRPPDRAKVHEIITAPVAGQPWTKRLAKWSKLKLDPVAIADEIATGISKGKNANRIGKSVETHLGVYAASARRIAHTETMRVHNRARQEGFDSFGDTIRGYKIVETLDDRTRPHHAARHGTVYLKPKWLAAAKAPGARPLSERPELPDEPYCRGTYVTVIATLDDILPDLPPPVVSSADGPIVDPESYARWFDAQGEGTRKKIVGPRRWSFLKQRLRGTEPQWAHFIEPATGKLVKLADLRRETLPQTLERTAQVEQDVRDRAAALAIARKAAPSLSSLLPPDVREQPKKPKVTKREPFRLDVAPDAPEPFRLPRRKPKHLLKREIADAQGAPDVPATPPQVGDLALRDVSDLGVMPQERTVTFGVEFSETMAQYREISRQRIGPKFKKYVREWVSYADNAGIVHGPKTTKGVKKAIKAGWQKANQHALFAVRTVYHETLHQFGAWRSYSDTERNLEEGLTEALAARLVQRRLDRLGLAKLHLGAYRDEVSAVTSIMHAVARRRSRDEQIAFLARWKASGGTGDARIRWVASKIAKARGVRNTKKLRAAVREALEKKTGAPLVSYLESKGVHLSESTLPPVPKLYRALSAELGRATTVDEVAAVGEKIAAQYDLSKTLQEELDWSGLLSGVMMKASALKGS